MLRIATWNINSVRLRLDLVMRLLDEAAPDVLCLQETKVIDDSFPLKALADRGYTHARVRGMKSYNGVAILSRLPLQSLPRQDWCDREDARHIAALLPGGVALHNFYVPAGGLVPDPEESDKFAHKLRFLDEMTAWCRASGVAGQRAVLVGDLNVAPHENDVWSHRHMINVVSHTPVEVARMDRLRQAGAWVDGVRRFIPETSKAYSWWPYTAGEWQASDRGRRLDHVWVTPDLAPSLSGARILRDVRGWGPKPSDHVPVVVDFDL